MPDQSRPDRNRTGQWWGKGSQRKERQARGKAETGSGWTDKDYARARSGSKAMTERRERRKKKRNEKSGGQGGCRFFFSSRHIGDPSVDKIFLGRKERYRVNDRPIYVFFFLHRTKFYKQIEKFLKNQIICVRVTLLGRCIVRYTIFK